MAAWNRTHQKWTQGFEQSRRKGMAVRPIFLKMPTASHRRSWSCSARLAHGGNFAYSSLWQTTVDGEINQTLSTCPLCHPPTPQCQCWIHHVYFQLLGVWFNSSTQANLLQKFVNIDIWGCGGWYMSRVWLIRPPTVVIHWTSIGIECFVLFCHVCLGILGYIIYYRSWKTCFSYGRLDQDLTSNLCDNCHQAAPELASTSSGVHLYS